MKRFLLTLGPIVSLAGAVGLILHGRAIVSVFAEVLTYKIVDPPAPLPATLEELGWVAMSGMGLTFGLVISCTGTVMRDRHELPSSRRKASQIIGGVLLLIGAISVIWGLFVAGHGFNRIATAAMTPRPDDIQEFVRAATPMLMVGFVVFAAATGVPFVAGQVRVGGTPRQRKDTPSMAGAIAVVGSLFASVIASLLLFGILRHGIVLRTLLSVTEVTPKPSDLVMHLAGILNKSLLTFTVVGCQGILQIVSTVFASASESRTE